MEMKIMSKLDDNNRWSGKMMITEHVAAYEQRKEPAIKGMATKEELTMIRDKVMLPHVMTMLQKGIDSIATSTFTLKDLSVRSLELLLQMAGEDDRQLRKELNQRKIKIHLDESGDDIFYYRYFCRGYEEKFGITHKALRAEISLRLTKYMERMQEAFKQRLTE
jgi:hypothetical protein